MSRTKKAFLILAILLFATGAMWAGGQADKKAPAAAPAATAVPTKFNEAPMLAAMVKAGAIPSVDKRLPKVPYVRQPLEGIGKYGGTLRTFNTNPNSWGDMQEAPDYSAFLTANDKTGKVQEPYCRKVAGVALKKKPVGTPAATVAKTTGAPVTTATAPADAAKTAAKTVSKPATAAVAAKPVVTPPAPPPAQ